MAQTKKKRRKKHKGTQGGRIDTSKRRTKPRSRAEAKAQARSRRGGGSGSAQKSDDPPTWRGAAMRGAIAAGIFLLFLLLLFKRPPAAAITLSALMLVFYVPGGYFIDMAMWRKRERARIRAREES